MTVDNAVRQAFLPVPYLKFFAPEQMTAADFTFIIYCEFVISEPRRSAGVENSRMKNEK
jgi:hypothetical protein